MTRDTLKDEGRIKVFHQLVVKICLFIFIRYFLMHLHQQIWSLINNFSLVRALCSRDETESPKQKSAFDQRSKQIHFSGGWRSTEKRISIHLKEGDPNFGLQTQGSRNSLWNKESGTRALEFTAFSISSGIQLHLGLEFSISSSHTSN